MQITEMMKELREKGTGEEELAAAHAKWLEEQDSYMLKRLVRDVKRGFGKGRKRVQVCAALHQMLGFLQCSPWVPKPRTVVAMIAMHRVPTSIQPGTCTALCQRGDLVCDHFQRRQQLANARATILLLEVH